MDEPSERFLTMSLHDYQAAKLLIEKAGGDFDGPKPETLIGAAEQALELKFAPSYRRFLLELGCGNLKGLEIYGVINENFDRSCVPNGIWLTLHERLNLGLSTRYVLIGDDGDSGYYAIDTFMSNLSGENPVVKLAVDGRQSEQIADSFGSYLLEAVKAAID